MWLDLHVLCKLILILPLCFLGDEHCPRLKLERVSFSSCNPLSLLPPQDSSDDIEDVSLFDADDDVSRRSKKSKIRLVVTERVSGMSLPCVSFQAVIFHISRTLGPRYSADPYPVHCWEIPRQCDLSAGAVTMLSFVPGTQWHHFSTYSSGSVPSLCTCSVSS